MANESVSFLYLSEILGQPVMDGGTGKTLGTVFDLAAAPAQVYPKIAGIIVKHRLGSGTVYVPWAAVRQSANGKRLVLESGNDPLTATTRGAENEILIKKSFLDRQLISTSGSKVVRVNDLQLLLDNSAKGNANLWLVHIDIGVKGLLRRLGWLRIANAAFRWMFSRDMKDKFISWKHVQPTTTTNIYGSLRLTSDSSKLSELLPADLADILEDLGVDDRISVIESLTPGTAAATLQEMALNIRAQVAETLEPGTLARIIEEMQMDESVDLLDELAPESRSAVFGMLSAEKASEIRELSRLSAYSVGRIMNTEFITAHKAMTVDETLTQLREDVRRAELIYYVYIVDERERLIGVVSLRSLLSSPGTTPIDDLMRENAVAVTVETNIKSVARIFFKYNFDAIPVLDDDGRVLGIVTLRDALESVFPRMRDDSKG